MYKSLTKTKKYPELAEKSGFSKCNIKHYISSSLITVKRHAMVLSFYTANRVGRRY